MLQGYTLVETERERDCGVVVDNLIKLLTQCAGTVKMTSDTLVIIR